jgi:hypothetical protein
MDLEGHEIYLLLLGLVENKHSQHFDLSLQAEQTFF